MAPKMRETVEESSSEEYESEPESEKEVVKSDSEGGDDEKEVKKSESEGGDDEGEDEEGSPFSPTASNFTIKPSNVKPSSKRHLEVCRDDGKKSRSKKMAKDAVKIVKTDKVSSVPSGQGAIQRVWSDEDELHLLQGFIDYRGEKGDPYANKTNKTAFYDFVKGRLFAGVGYNQVYEKLRRLKEKFEKIQGQRKARDTVFSTPHELERFELSEKVWGGGSKSKELEQKPKAKSKNVEYSGKTRDSLLNSNAKVSVVREKKKKDERAILEKERTKKDDKGDSFMDGVDIKATNGQQRIDGSSEFLSKYPNLCRSFNVKMSFLKDNLHLIGKNKAEELEERWVKLQMKKMGLASESLSLLAEQTELVVDAIKKG